MDYHGNHIFTDVKKNDFEIGRPCVSYIVELSHMLHKTCYFRQVMDRFFILYKWAEYFDPSS